MEQTTAREAVAVEQQLDELLYVDYEAGQRTRRRRPRPAMG